MAKTLEKVTIDVQAMIDDLATKANVALKEMESFDQEKVDHIVHEMAMAALDKHMPLAKMAVKKLAVVSMKIKRSKHVRFRIYLEQYQT